MSTTRPRASTVATSSLRYLVIEPGVASSAASMWPSAPPGPMAPPASRWPEIDGSATWLDVRHHVIFVPVGVAATSPVPQLACSSVAARWRQARLACLWKLRGSHGC